VSDVKTVGACSRCGKVGGDDWAIGATGYTRRWTDVAELCDVCYAALQVWVTPAVSRPCGHCYHEVGGIGWDSYRLVCCQCSGITRPGEIKA
jgi:hypothetical protein